MRNERHHHTKVLSFVECSALARPNRHLNCFKAVVKWFNPIITTSQTTKIENNMNCHRIKLSINDYQRIWKPRHCHLSPWQWIMRPWSTFIFETKAAMQSCTDTSFLLFSTVVIKFAVRRWRKCAILKLNRRFSLEKKGKTAEWANVGIRKTLCGGQMCKNRHTQEYLVPWFIEKVGKQHCANGASVWPCNKSYLNFRTWREFVGLQLLGITYRTFLWLSKSP